MLFNFPHILADSDELPVRAIFFVIVLIIWGIKAMAGLAGKASQREKERLRAVRQSIEQSQRLGQVQMPPPQAPRRPARAAVVLAPEIARRVPPPRISRAPQKQKPARPATNYNAMAQAPRRPNVAPPPLPPRQPALEEVVLLPEPPPKAAVIAVRKPATVGAVAIHRWLSPATLKQQYILTELFQAPLSLRDRTP
jgi:hypothetical protein